MLNTVERATNVWKALNKLKSQSDSALQDTDIHLIHSRFRPCDRKKWHDVFNRGAGSSKENSIIVSTQVVEAGVDISASLLITELAPWTSLVQRFGRCARWGGEGKVIIADFQHKDDRRAAPYSLHELETARKALCRLNDVAPRCLEEFEDDQNNDDLLPVLYPYDPQHLLLRHELDELFDTTSDLSGADIDISRFIRSGEERDVQVFWKQVGKREDPSSDVHPMREELCSIPSPKACKWLCGSSNHLQTGKRAWIWDWLDRRWSPLHRHDIFPGQTILVDSCVGGYNVETGWDPGSTSEVAPLDQQGRSFSDGYSADAAEEDESLSVIEDETGWQTIATHGLQVGSEVQVMSNLLSPDQSIAGLLHLAGRWHDVGKAHPAFQGSIDTKDCPERHDIAKAPRNAWLPRKELYRIDEKDQRRGFRHELASALGLFSILERHYPQHAALLGPWEQWFDTIDKGSCHETSDDTSPAPSNTQFATQPTEIEREILALSADDFDLLAYLICSHHGKIRMTWHSSPADQSNSSLRFRIRGVQQDDELPSITLFGVDGRTTGQLPAARLNLSPSEMGISRRTGRSWTERVLRLLERLGPFRLAWLEALLRAADQRASMQELEDSLLSRQGS